MRIIATTIIGLIGSLAAACGDDTAPSGQELTTSDTSASSDVRPRPDATGPGDGDTRDTTPLDAAGPNDVGANAGFEEPIRVVFKIHIEPQSTVDRYRGRRDDVQAVAAIAERYGARLTLHGNGEFWQYATEEGDEAVVAGWLAAGHDVGPHMHSVYEEPDGSHNWTNASQTQQRDEDFVRALWDDHLRPLEALLPAETFDQATPYNSLDANYVDMMADYGFTISGGGRHEISKGWFGHHPFYPWRLGASYLEEDLLSPILIVHHQSQLGEAKDHGPPGGRVFQDHTVPHLQVQFLQVYLNRLHAQRTGDPDDRVWLYGFLTHDNQSDEARRAEIETFLGWLTGEFADDIEMTTFSDVRDAYLDWERAHPGVSSWHVETPTPIDPADATRITDEESRRVYPGAFWGLARHLRADEETVVDFEGFDDRFTAQDVRAAVLLVGPRDGGARTRRMLLWSTSGQPSEIDLSAVTGNRDITNFDVVTGEASSQNANAVYVAADTPTLVELDDTTSTCDRSLGDLADTAEVVRVGDPIPCDPTDTSGDLCGIFRVQVGPMAGTSGPAHAPALDDQAMTTNALLAVRANSAAALCDARWIVFDAGGYGAGYGPSFGGVLPGRHRPGGDGYGDDLIESYVDAGYVTVDVIWECDASPGGFCEGAPPIIADWKPTTAGSRGWFQNLDGSGYMGAASRSRAVYTWASENAGGRRICAHAQSSGSGRLIATLTSFAGATDLFDTVVFDGGPVWTYLPWVCGSDEGPLGPRPPSFARGDGVATLGNIDCAFSPGVSEDGCSYTSCSTGGYDPTWLDHSPMWIGDPDLGALDVGIALGGADTSPAWKHVTKWLAGHSYEGVSVEPLQAASIVVRQGYCERASDTFADGTPCALWDAARLVGVSGAGLGYDARLAASPHGTTTTAGGMEVVRELMLETCEPQ